MGYIAYDEELPGANTQGRTLEEARANFFEAVDMTIEANLERKAATVPRRREIDEGLC